MPTTQELRQQLDDAIDALQAELKPLRAAERAELNAAEDRYHAERKRIIAKHKPGIYAIERRHSAAIHAIRNQLQIATSRDFLTQPHDCGSDYRAHEPALDKPAPEPSDDPPLGRVHFFGPTRVPAETAHAATDC